MCLNTQWASHLDGLLGQLLDACIWAGTETQVETAVQEVQKLLVKLADVGSCEEEPTVTPYALFRDEKSVGINGGTFTSGAWRRRELGITVENDGIATLVDHQVVLIAGTYRCHIACPAYACNEHQVRFQNITDSTTAIFGSIGFSNSSTGGGYPSVCVGRIVLSAPKVFEVQHRCVTTRNNDGFGRASNFGTEIYTIAEFWKES